MKKLFRLTLATAFLLLPGAMYAQMTISSTGQITVGQHIKPYNPGTPGLAGAPADGQRLPDIGGFGPGSGLGGNENTEQDSLATINVWSFSQGGRGGYISFGPRYGRIGYENGCGVGQINIGSAMRTKFTVGANNVLNLNRESISASYDVKAPSFITTSDLRLKKDTRSLSDLDGLMELSPVSYRLKSADTATAQKESAASPAAPDNRLRYGFIAQEVKEIFPNLVVEDEEGWLGIDYTGFIPLLVEAYKEMKQEVTDLRAQLADVTLPAERRSKARAGAESIPVSAVASLSQNKPNPFNTATVINYTLPESCSEAYLYLFDLQGKQLMKTECRDRGAGAVTIEAGKLAPGMYVYTLVADSEEVDTKRMIVSD